MDGMGSVVSGPQTSLHKSRPPHPPPTSLQIPPTPPSSHLPPNPAHPRQGPFASKEAWKVAETELFAPIVQRGIATNLIFLFVMVVFGRLASDHATSPSRTAPTQCHRRISDHISTYINPHQPTATHSNPQQSAQLNPHQPTSTHSNPQQSAATHINPNQPSSTRSKPPCHNLPACLRTAASAQASTLPRWR